MSPYNVSIPYNYSVEMKYEGVDAYLKKRYTIY